MNTSLLNVQPCDKMHNMVSVLQMIIDLGGRGKIKLYINSNLCLDIS